MTDTNDTKRPAKTLTLKKTETSTVKQSFSHGRTKAVVVEKKRTAHPPAAAKPAAPKKEAPVAEAAPAPKPAPARETARPGVVLRQLTEAEKARRGAALADARVHEEDARKRAEEDARRRVEEEALLQKEREAALRRKVEEEKRKAAEELARKHAEEEAARRTGGEAPRPGAPASAEAPRTRRVNEEEDEAPKKVGPGGKIAPKTPATRKPGGDDRRRGKLTVTRA
ncbi:MAG TPA: translation initiation factor IF-2 associated domain-containing protein, partial [Rhizomicrobium sp.]|nr:translation initiation factor IF-2 associated domain-containing protein [Rhizomicrobium sp.]